MYDQAIVRALRDLILRRRSLGRPGFDDRDKKNQNRCVNRKS
jgi:hypothetical protein